METIWGKASLDLNLIDLQSRLENYGRVILDLGTGDGRYVHSLADTFPAAFVIGVDACREKPADSVKPRRHAEELFIFQKG
ncbi:MAG: class I SAM-dependent methyltransferase [Chloroflexi bacterium]|nr:class I SAM-dependent methyltransferase [Chloroflexota bacterium]